MTLSERILKKIEYECKLIDEARVHDYVMNRKKDIVAYHTDNVCRIYEPGEGGQKYYMTKLTPQHRNHAGKIYAKTKEELEEKIIAYYLKISNDENATIRKVLVNALGGDESTFGKTPKRTIQRFDKNLSGLASIRISRLTESDIRLALDNLLAQTPTEKEFNATVTCLNKLSDYCQYEHIDTINIREAIAVYRKVRLTGKHIFKPIIKQTRDLAFTRAEAANIVRYALKHPTYKSLSVALLIVTGLRAGELLALTLEDIHIDEGYLWIHRIEDTKTYDILDYVKENKAREVYLSDEAVTVLKACLTLRNEEGYGIPYLLLNSCSDDGKMHLRAIDDYLREHIHPKVLGYGDNREARSAHDCRRTYASLEYLNGTPINVIKDQLGHSDVGQTWDYIKNVVDASERRSQLKGGGLLFEVLEDKKSKKQPNNVVDAVWTHKRAK